MALQKDWQLKGNWDESYLNVCKTIKLTSGKENSQEYKNIDILLQSVSSVAQSCLIPLCDPMDCSMSGFPVHHQLSELTQTHVHRVNDAMQPSHPLSSLLSRLQSFPASGSFPTSQLFKSGCHSIGASASASVLPMNIQGWFPLGLTGLISLQSKGLSSTTLPSTTVRKHQFISTQIFL